MVSRHYHEGTKHDRFISAFFDRLNDIFTGSILRLSFHGSDKDIGISQILHLRLHLIIGNICRMRGSMSHEDKGNPRLLRLFQAAVLPIRQRRLHNRLTDSLLVRIDLGVTLSHFSKERLCHFYRLELILVLVYGTDQFIVLCPVHQMSRLYHQLFDSILYCTLQRLIHVVDLLLIPCLNMVDNDLRSKGPPYRPVRKSLLQRLLDSSDVRHAAIVKGSTKADHQQLFLPDPVLIKRIVCGCIPRIPSKIFRVGMFSFDQRFLLVCQSIPSFLCLFTLCIGLIRSLLHIDGINQLGNLIRLLLIAPGSYSFFRGGSSRRLRSFCVRGHTGSFPALLLCTSSVGTRLSATCKGSDGNQTTA